MFINQIGFFIKIKYPSYLLNVHLFTSSLPLHIIGNVPANFIHSDDHFQLVSCQLPNILKNIHFPYKMSEITGSAIVSFPSLDQFEGLLECPCCLEPPVPPITCCITGHIICSFCRPKLSRCALCREKYTDTRNFPLESIFRACIISCKYSELGCQLECRGENYATHLRQCSFRLQIIPLFSNPI
jgi:hypothetical protein